MKHNPVAASLALVVWPFAATFSQEVDSAATTTLDHWRV